MSNPPYGNLVPVNSDDDFSFQVETPKNNALENHPFIENEINPDYYWAGNTQGISSSEYQDLSIFLDEQEEEEESNRKQVGGNDEGRSPSGLEVGQGSSSSSLSTKKQDHNAKERVRRMKLNSTFISLRSLLPHSRKKRWSAPYVIDKALEYIPHLENEIQKLTLAKDKLLSLDQANKQVTTRPVVVATSTHHDQQQSVRMHGKEAENKSGTLTVSINQVKHGEVIIQICQDKDKAGSVLTTLFEKLEGKEQGIQVLGASALCASQDRSCFHLHIQMSENPQESEYVAILHQKIISWLS